MSETEFKTTHGVYAGRTLAGQGTKKDGDQWKKWKLTFQPNEKSDKTFNFSFFQNGKVNGEDVTWTPLPEMTEGNWYTVNYTAKPGNYQGKAITFKTMYKFREGKMTPEEEAQNKLQYEQQKATPVAVATTKVAQNWEAFQKGYNEAMNGDPLKSDVHMLGLYVINNHAEEFASVIALIKSNFGTLDVKEEKVE